LCYRLAVESSGSVANLATDLGLAQVVTWRRYLVDLKRKNRPGEGRLKGTNQCGLRCDDTIRK